MASLMHQTPGRKGRYTSNTKQRHFHCQINIFLFHFLSQKLLMAEVMHITKLQELFQELLEIIKNQAKVFLLKK